MDLTLITVVTPSFNNENTILDTIDSVLMQRYPNIQYIISDDCSENFDAEALKNYIEIKSKGNITDILILRNEVNLGISKNLNHALTFAKGKYIFNIAADDMFYDENVLMEWTDQFEATGADVITALRAVYNEDLTKELYIAPNDDDIEIIRRSTPQQLFEEMTAKNLIFGCCTARSKRIFDQMGNYDERYPMIEDYPANMKLLRHNIPIVFWNRIVVKYRIGGISSLGQISDRYLAVSDDIFYHEILPFTKYPKQAKSEYKFWRDEAIWARDGKSLKTTQKAKPLLLNRAAYILIMTFKHPIIALKKISKRLKIYGH